MAQHVAWDHAHALAWLDRRQELVDAIASTKRSFPIIGYTCVGTNDLERAVHFYGEL